MVPLAPRFYACPRRRVNHRQVFSTAVCLLTSPLSFLCHFEPAAVPSLPPVSRGGSMADAWHGPSLTDETLAFGPLALIAPLLQRLDLAAIIDRHLPPDPQLAFTHGRVLSLLL